MLGNGAGMGLLGGSDSVNTWLSELMQASAQAEGLTWDINLSGGGTSSDSRCFKDAGIPFCYGMTRGSHPEYHTPQDTIDKIKVVDLQMTAELFYVTLRDLAMGEESKLIGGRPPPARARSKDPRPGSRSPGKRSLTRSPAPATSAATHL
jgi:hypothetical protein